MDCSKSIEEDIISSSSRDSSIDYEEQNNVEASFDYNNVYEEDYSDDDQDYEEEEEEEVLQSPFQEKNVEQKINKNFQNTQRSELTQNIKTVLQEATNNESKLADEKKNLINSINKLKKQNDYTTLDVLQQQNQKKGVKDNLNREQQDQDRLQTNENECSSQNQNIKSLAQLNNSIIMSIPKSSSTQLDLQSTKVSNSDLLQKCSQNSIKNIVSTNSSKKKNIITFELNKNESKLTLDLLKKKQVKSQIGEYLNIKQGESFRVLQSPRDGKNLPNIDKIKAKFNKLKQKPPKITSRSWIILNGKNKKLVAGQNENQVREIASLTKMMTCYIVVHYIRKLNLIPEKTYFKVSAHAANQPGTTAGLTEGDVVSIMDLLYGMMLPSGNDAAFVLAENFGVYLYMQTDKFKEKYGNAQTNKKLKVKNPITYFIKEMNDFAEKLNMQDTYFTNPHGLMHKKNKSTSYDVGLLSYYLIHDPLIKQIMAQQTYNANIMTETLQLKNPPTIWKNTNKMLKKTGFLGLKTGITPSAGPCLASWYNHENINLIIILLGAKSLEERWVETVQLLEWAKKQMQQKKKEKNVNS
ncbi:D-alanyl-D-alanine carboxypeptidase family protein (macronuclear) [Tetrahymena thermophila SB210]|uniref:D-alanyl-D-alanine carboxypeptidase family protein n=1 Tax=Tetrahymena thermophila (strain SB210) TaxID=312017 RepID=I7MAA9_TETTS|nr:D-alanyl-D-alanine carboxypeptidase family protein [Tetrahymena thermophila SB210]EAS04236.3 D-alanyl-D-alanine carboxypeptidase family protein [Tetrahymena thermophila SB210]|eukprot:XP_001024481.3 D-alanyl-D-alanine carboxypeptidase family protein [Tetrahymena thermophila SB210]